MERQRERQGTGMWLTTAPPCRDTHGVAPDSRSYFQAEILLQVEMPAQTEQQDKHRGFVSVLQQRGAISEPTREG